MPIMNARLSGLDRMRVLYPTECCWASSVVGAELDFAIVTDFSDIDALSLPRRLQRKIGRGGGHAIGQTRCTRIA